MARTRKAVAAHMDVAYLISADVLASVCPRPLIEEVLAGPNVPAPAVAYYAMAFAL